METIDFINKLKEKHNNKYDYSLVNYTGCLNMIKIICPIHGIFEQKAHKHLYGQGCKNCAVDNRKLNTEIFIEKAKKTHGEKFDYSNSIYIGAFDKVKINCYKHGIFEQLASKHLSGDGCQICGGSTNSNKEEFVFKSKKIHGETYIYDKVTYINNKTKVSIECVKHGNFEQLPSNHLKGSGCPVCNKSKGEIKIENYLKENNINYKPQYDFADLRFKETLRFDFGLLDKDNNLKCLVEYNGVQHYEFIKFIHKTEEIFNIAKLRDKLKEEYCTKNNIPLIIIKYDEDINKKLKLINMNAQFFK